MADPFLGEISIFAFAYVPKFWALCNGQKLPVAQNAALFSLLGNSFGGNGMVTFQLPDLQGRVPIGTQRTGTVNYSLGQKGGCEQVALTEDQLPSHTHPFVGINAPGTRNGPGTKQNRLLANSNAGDLYSMDVTSLVQMNDGTCTGTGNGAPHNNIQPSMALNFLIAVNGIYPNWD